VKKILLILICLFFTSNVYSEHNNFTEEIANQIVEEDFKNGDKVLKKRWEKVAIIKL